jgi:hypothetical protein
MRGDKRAGLGGEGGQDERQVEGSVLRIAQGEGNLGDGCEERGESSKRDWLRVPDTDGRAVASGGGPEQLESVRDRRDAGRWRGSRAALAGEAGKGGESRCGQRE